MKVFVFLTVLLTIAKQIISENPYRILEIAPYFSMNEVKIVCHKLKKLYHPDKFKGDKELAREKFNKIQKACKEIKESRPDEAEDKETNGIYHSLRKCLISICISVGVIIILYFFSLFLLKFFGYFMKFFIIFAISFFLIDGFLAHHFEAEESQYFYTFLLALVGTSSGWMRDYFFGKKNDVPRG